MGLESKLEPQFVKKKKKKKKMLSLYATESHERVVIWEVMVLGVTVNIY